MIRKGCKFAAPACRKTSPSSERHGNEVLVLRQAFFSIRVLQPAGQLNSR